MVSRHFSGPIGVSMVEHTTLDAVSKFSSEIGRKRQGKVDLLDLIDNELLHIEALLHEAGEDARDEFRKVPDLIRRDVGALPLFEIAELAQSIVHLYGEQSDERIPHDVRYVFSGLATRAIATFREIAILLDNGYAFGAKSRWRTLSEILVVARVLVKGNRYTASRYKEHRWVMFANQRKVLEQQEWTMDLPEPEVMRKRLAKRFGNSYLDGHYGWASKVVAKELDYRKRVHWYHLERIADLGDLKPRVQDAHHAVHADSLGLLGTIDDARGIFHSGASPQEVLEVARDSVHLFRLVMWALFRNCTKYSKQRTPLVYQGLIEVHSLNNEILLSERIFSKDETLQRRYFEKLDEMLGGNLFADE